MPFEVFSFFLHYFSNIQLILIWHHNFRLIKFQQVIDSKYLNWSYVDWINPFTRNFILCLLVNYKNACSIQKPNMQNMIEKQMINLTTLTERFKSRSITCICITEFMIIRINQFFCKQFVNNSLNSLPIKINHSRMRHNSSTVQSLIKSIVRKP